VRLAATGLAALTLLFGAAQARAATSVVIGFDDLASGSSVSNQYASKGVELGHASDFGQAAPSGGGNCGSPTVGSGTVPAFSTPNYARLATCAAPGGVPVYRSGTFGALVTAPSSSVSAEVRVLSVGVPSLGISITAYDASGSVVATGSGNAASGSWTAIAASQSSGAPAIRYFAIATSSGVSDPASAPQIAIDDLTFDQPSSGGGGGGAPSAALGLDTQAPQAGSPVRFNGGGSTPGGGGRIISYDWDFNGDGHTDTSTGTNPISHFIFAPGVHTVGLTVTDSNGQHSSAQLTFTTATVAPKPFEPDGGQGDCQPTYDNGNVHIIAECVQTLAGGGYVIETRQLDLNGMVLEPKVAGYAVFKILPFNHFGIGSGLQLSGPEVNVELLNTPVGDMVLGGIDLTSDPIQLQFKAFVPPHVQLARHGAARGHRADNSSKTLLMSLGVGHSCKAGDKNPSCCPPSGGTTSCATLPGDFPLTGQIKVYLNNKAQVLFDAQVGLDLSAVNFEATGALEVIADLQSGINLGSLQFNIPEAGLASIFQVKDASFVYYFPSDPDASKRDTWQAKATFIFGPLSQPSLAAELDFKQGNFQFASMLFTAPTGTGVPIYPGILLNQLGGSVGVNPLQFGGQLGASIATQLELSLAFKYRDATDTQLGFFGGQGTLSLSSDKIATLSADVYSDGYTDAQLSIDLHFPFDSKDPVVSVGGDIGFWDEPSSGRWEADGDVHMKLWVISAEVAGLINNTYIAGCADVSGFGVQGRYRLADGNIDGGFFGFSNCKDQLKQYKETPVNQHSGGFVSRRGGARAAAPSGGGGSFKLPGGQLGEELRVSSSSGAPVVVLTGPGGQQFKTPAAPGQISSVAGKFISAISPDGHQLLILLSHPQGGTWKINPVAGSAAVTKVETAADVPPAKIHLRVRHRRGRVYALAYRIANHVAGTKVQFVERGRDSTHVIGTVKNGRGVLDFVPQDAIGRSRRIVAYIRSAQGAPLRTLVAGRYLAPAAIRPGRVRHLRFARHGTSAVLTWGRTPSAKQYRVRIAGSDGRLTTVFTAPRARRVALQEVVPSTSLRAIVVAEGGPNLLPGPAARVRLGGLASHVELLTCAKGSCRATRVAGSLVPAANEIHAVLRRGRRVYATGIASALRAPGRLTLVPRRRLVRGRYKLTLSYRRGHHRRTAHRSIVIA
jgi:PKD repeat protein